MSYKQGIDRDQILLIARCLNDLIQPDTICKKIDAFCDNLDLDAYGLIYPAEALLTASYHPRTLLKLCLYGKVNRISAPKRLEIEAKRNLDVVWLLQALQPKAKAIANFQRKNTAAIKAIWDDFRKRR